MSRVLAHLLGRPEVELASELSNYERASGQPGVDVRLIAELSATVHRKMRELGLDPHDTTAKELYHALQALVGQHDEFLAAILKAPDPHDVTAVLPRLAQAVSGLSVAKECWAIKHSVLKKLLKKQPPKHVMKQLGYRSLDSMLKRENPAVLLATARFAETPAWLTKFVKQYKKLQSSDFEHREVEIVCLEGKRWGKLADPYVQSQHHNVTHLKESGIILILPLPVDRMRGLFVTLLPLILHYVAEIRLYSALFKLEQVKPDFGEILIKTLLQDPNDAAAMAGKPLHWRTVARHYGKHPKSHPTAFQPHVQPEDLYYQKAEDVLYWLEPALKFWDGLDYVLVQQPGIRPISLSLLDNAISYCNNLEFGQQVIGHAQRSMWNELLLRYMGQESLERQVIEQLGDGLVEPSSLEIA